MGDGGWHALSRIPGALGLMPSSSVRLRNRDLTKFEVKTVENGRSTTQVRYQLAVPRVKKRKEFREVKLRPVSNGLGGLLEGLRFGEPDGPLFHWLCHRQRRRRSASV